MEYRGAVAEYRTIGIIMSQYVEKPLLGNSAKIKENRL